MATNPIAAVGDGDSRETHRWIEPSKNKKKFYSQKLQKKTLNSSYIPRPQQSFQALTCDDNDDNSSRPQQKRLDTVASNDSSSHSRSQPVPHSSRSGTGNSLPGYVQFDDKVRISLYSGSKSVIRELKRKLVSELDHVRSLKQKLEAKEIQYDDNGMMGSGGYTNGVGTLARVNSEVSYVGPTNPRPLQGLAVSVDDNSNNFDYGSVGENVDKEKKTKKTPKGNQNHKNPDSVIRREKILNSESKKKLKPDNGGKKGSGAEVMKLASGMDKQSREMFKKCGDLLGKLMKHQYGWVFNEPVDVKKLMLHDYYKIIKRPMDLGTVKSRLKKNWYKSPKEFAEDVRLTFNNAMTYNEKGQDVHIMADVMLKLFEEKWAALKGEFNFNGRIGMGYDESMPTTNSKRAPAPPALAPTSAPPQKMPLETRTLERSESTTKPMASNLKTADIPAHEGRMPIPKKPKAKNVQKREMTFEEKQKLSTDLLSLPSEKLESVVQIIKKRNPGLCQQEDEIEVDIDSVDTETLWELDAVVADYKESLDQNKGKSEPASQPREEAGHNFHETVRSSTII